MSHIIFKVYYIFVLIYATPTVSPQILPIVDYLQSWFVQHEQPPYTLVRTISPNIEERIYPSRKWVCIEEFNTALKIDGLRSEMFFKLFAYSEGRNDISKKIEVTLPISTSVEHRNGDLNSYQMCMYLPTEFQANPPIPKPSNIKISTRPNLRIYAKVFGGYADESTFTKELQNLAAALKAENLPYIEEEFSTRAIHYNNIFDAPGKFWNRRNEVWVISAVPA